MTFGEFLKQKRIALGCTLRTFCLENGFNYSNYSRLERNVLVPIDNLSKYATALKIEYGSDEWFEFCDLASIAQRTIFSVSDEIILGRLPVLLHETKKI